VGPSTQPTCRESVADQVGDVTCRADRGFGLRAAIGLAINVVPTAAAISASVDALWVLK